VETRAGENLVWYILGRIYEEFEERAIFASDYSFTMSDTARGFINHCLITNRRAGMTAHQALRHYWIEFVKRQNATILIAEATKHESQHKMCQQSSLPKAKHTAKTVNSNANTEKAAVEQSQRHYRLNAITIPIGGLHWRCQQFQTREARVLRLIDQPPETAALLTSLGIGERATAISIGLEYVLLL